MLVNMMWLDSYCEPVRISRCRADNEGVGWADRGGGGQGEVGASGGKAGGGAGRAGHTRPTKDEVSMSVCCLSSQSKCKARNGA